jgi:hypothetical protein
MNKKFPTILNSLLAEVACNRIYNRLNIDIYDYGENPMIDEQYMKNVFLDPGEFTLSNFNEMYRENHEDLYEEYPDLYFIEESVCKDYAIEKVIAYGLNFMRTYHNYYESDILIEESTYGNILQLINKDNVYCV